MAKINKKFKRAGGQRKNKKPARSSSTIFVGQSMLQQAIALHRAGRLAEAEALYRQLLTAHPDHPEALLHLGILAHQVGKYDIAVELLLRALALRPDFVEAHYNLGMVRLDVGKTTEAEAAFRQSLRLRPEYAAAHNALGNALLLLGSTEEAAASYRRAVTQRPDYAVAHYNLGNVLDDLGKPDEAAASYRRAIALQPDYAEAHYNLGFLLQGQGKPDEAAACYRQSLAARPDYIQALNNLGIVLKDQGELMEAMACFRRALALHAGYAEAHSNLLLCMNYVPSQNVPSYLEEARRFGRQAAARAYRPFTDWNCTAKPTRLRVGLVSGDFRNHPAGYFLENMLEHLDATQIELAAYPTNRCEDELTARIRRRFAVWKNLEALDDASAASLIHADGVHILLDLSGHTSHNRLPLFAWKPAPVQVTWLGYFASTGLAEMDYILVDPVSVPEMHQGHFTEKVWYLPETRLCFTPPGLEEDLPLSPLPALASGRLTFGCFQNLAKINDEVLAVWGKILRLLPQAGLRLQDRLFESPAIREQLQQRLACNGIAPERVRLERNVPRQQYLAAHEQIDIILDTFPFSGCTTTCEALWMGVPTLTVAGERMVSRQSASLLSCAGLRDWIAADLENYAEKAVAHAADLDKLARQRKNLRGLVLTSPLFDGAGFAANFESAMWGMWRRFEGSN